MKMTIYTDDYVSSLQQKVKNGTFKDLYNNGVFEDPDEDIIDIDVVDYDDSNLTLSTNINDVFDNAVKLYETYHFTPTEASNGGLWTYLSFHKFAEFNHEAYNIEDAIKSDVKLPKFLNDHYIVSGSATNLLRHTLAGLWWAVHLTVREDETEKDKKYELTKVLFRQKSFVSRLLSVRIISVKPAIQGLLEFILKNEKLFDTYFETRMRMSITFINRLGGTKLIASMDKDFFFNELEKIKPLLESSTDRASYKEKKNK